MHAALFLVLPRDEALLLGQAVVNLSDLAAQRHGGLVGVLLVELHLHIELLALRLQLQRSLFCGGRHVIHHLDGRSAFHIVGGLVGVAGHQHAFAAALFHHTGALFGILAVLGVLGCALQLGERGANLAARDARRAEFALLAVQAFRDGPVGRQPTAVAVHARVNTARRTLGLCRSQLHAQGEQHQPAHDPRRLAQIIYPSLTPYRWR
ncbi:hypothetical protein D3C71_1470070 [compost metagenome]